MPLATRRYGRVASGRPELTVAKRNTREQTNGGKAGTIDIVEHDIRILGVHVIGFNQLHQKVSLFSSSNSFLGMPTQDVKIHWH